MQKSDLLVDSSFFVALGKPQDSLKEKATSFELENSGRYNFLITNHTYIEILTVLSYKTNKETAIKFARLVSLDDYIKVIHTNSSVERNALKIFTSDPSKNISMVDCISLAAIEYYGFKEFLTFDKTDFKKYQNKLKFKILG